MTSTEIKEFKEEIKEEILLLIPEVVGNMIMELKALSEMNEDFYKKHTEFKGHEKIVASVLAGMEDPLKDFADIVKEAPDKIRKRINTMKNIDLENVNTSPDITFKKDEQIVIPESGKFESGNGEL
ncbi:MAG: hypothetical protein KAJ18_11685 [Candidatus Omnitrophica bacterium]|nr:hypothetical protein [Candidatus Omnitrophota bacterium]